MRKSYSQLVNQAHETVKSRKRRAAVSDLVRLGLLSREPAFRAVSIHLEVTEGPYVQFGFFCFP